MNDGPNYKKYTLDELYDVLKHIDKDAYPDRYIKLKEEIEWRESESYVEETKISQNNIVAAIKTVWKRRLLAFIIDSLIIQAIWGALNNLIVIPLPEIIISLLHYLLFVFYFILTEGLFWPNKGIGKRLLGLKVSHLNSGSESWKLAAKRSAFIGFFMTFEYGSFFLFTQTPPVINSILDSFLYCFVLYNIYASIYAKYGATIHDFATQSLVDANPEPRFPEANIANFKFNFKLMGILFVCIFIVNICWVIFLHNTNPLLRPAYTSGSITTKIEKMVADSSGFRINVEVNDVVTYSSSSDNSKKLEIEIWVPWVFYNKPMRDSIANLILRNLSLQPGYYEHLELSVGSGATIYNPKIIYEFDLRENSNSESN